MAQSKNGPIIGLAIFIVLSIVFAVFWYMSHADNEQIRSQMLAAQKDKQDAEATVRDLNDQINFMKDRTGYGREMEVGHQDSGDSAAINKTSNDEIALYAADGNGAPADFRTALMKTAQERNSLDFTATQRKSDYDAKENELLQTITRKDQEIQAHRDAREKAEQELVKQEAAHSEEMQRLETQNDTLRKEKTAIDQEYADYKVTAEQTIQDLNADIDGYRNAVVALRQRLREQQDPTFSRPDGLVTDVDHVNGRCFINIGRADGLEVGVTFSVYTQTNSGVGRASTDDIKGKIEVVQILGAHSAVAAIVDEKPGRPIATEDPIFSPVFQSGQALEIAIVGGVTIDGLSRAELHRLVRASGSKVSVEVNDQGDFVDARGNLIPTEDDARAKITSKTRFIVIADLGDSETKDQSLQILHKKINDNANVLRKEAEKLGIYEVGLSTFLEYIGYSRKQMAWTPESSQRFPGVLPNGAKSHQVNASFGNRTSSAVISGRFSERRRQTSISSGTTSKAYSN